jgi:Tfp pilus assembly protein PilF
MNIRGNRSWTAAGLTALALTFAGGCAGTPRRTQPAPAPQTDDARLARAYDLLRANRPEDAAAALSALLRDDPDDGRARLELAYLDIRLQRWREAVALLDAAIEQEPANMRLRMERGYARQALGDLAPASDEFAAVAREPGEFQEQARAALAAVNAQDGDAARKVRVDAVLNAGYDDLRRGDKAGASDKFKAALELDPGRVEIAKQLGYMSMADGDLAAAAKRFAGVSILQPQDYATALQLGYIDDSLHNEADAQKAFAAALASPDPKIHDAASAALKVVRTAEKPLFLDVYGSPYYSSRFGDKIAYLETQLGWKPDPSWPFLFFLGGRYTQDSISHGGTAPQIYADDALSAGPGLRVQPKGWNASLALEEDASWNLIRSPAHPRAVEADGRVVLADYGYWDGPARTFADAGGSAGYYSRYRNNVIGLLQVRGGFRVLDGGTRLLAYAPVNVIKDKNRDFYNNLGEIGAGLELQPLQKWNVKLRAEWLHGFYMGITGVDPNPYGRQYDDLRVTLIFSGRFAAETRPAGEEPARRPDGFRW